MRLFEFAPGGSNGGGSSRAYAYFWLEYETPKYGEDEGFGVVPIEGVSDTQLAYLQKMSEQQPDAASELSDEMLFNLINLGGRGAMERTPVRTQMNSFVRNYGDVNHNHEEFEGQAIDLQWIARMCPEFASVLGA